ncbi:diguanylate cyclase [Aquibacillus halophilus]|uniref:Diguanylate cyclase n=1 Tax=Aquibacillus halophilus TaxID=930132 RepID=A0A6A8D7L9_9BACI|nr:sensor domain-containing diguanylate cyclase [Aquibacillus halophilus]MRH41745.1 diguanylate cyclase [Aquibacillus halophilus]
MFIVILSLFYFAITCYLLYLSYKTYLKNRESPIHKVASLLIFSFALVFLIFFFKQTLPDETTRFLVIALEFPVYLLQICLVADWFRLLTNENKKITGFWQRWGIYLPIVLITPLFFINDILVKNIVHLPYAKYIEYGPAVHLVGLHVLIYVIYMLTITSIYLKKAPEENVRQLSLLRIGLIFYFIWAFGWGIIQSQFIFMSNFPPMIIYAEFFLIYAMLLTMKKYNFLPYYETRYQILFDVSPIAIILVNSELIIKELNKQTTQLFNLQEKDILNRCLGDFIPKVIVDTFYSSWVRGLQQNMGLRNYQLTLKHPDTGQDMHLLVDSEFIKVENEMMQYVMIRDITQEKLAESKVRFLAYHDTLTGLANRHHFNSTFSEWLYNMKDQKNQQFSLLAIDLDNFKEINDTFGHDVGDKVLIKVASIFEAHLPPDSFVARIGGDEFALLIAGGFEDAELFVNDLLEVMNEPFMIEDAQIQTSCSVGITNIDSDTLDENLLMKQADQAMYGAKREGKSTYKVYA